MRIDSIEITNFKGVESGEFVFHPQFNLIVGKNGTGKTSALDALAVAAGSWFLGLRGYDTRHIWPSETRLKAKNFSGEIKFEPQFPVKVVAFGEVSGEEIEWERCLEGERGKTRFVRAVGIKALAASAEKSARDGEDVVLPLISYYGTGRLWQEPKTITKIKSPEKLLGAAGLSRLDGYRNSIDPRLSTKDLILWIARQSWIGYQEGTPSPILKVVQQAIVKCVEGAKKIYFDPKRGEVVLDTEHHGAQPFSNLSDGQRSMLAMVGDIAQKAARLNPQFGADVLLKTPGIVLIDELDLHLHPRWQRHMIEDLRTTFPKIQFICTTHSPFLIQSLRSGEELIVLDAQPPAKLGNKNIDEIITGIMNVPLTESSARYSEMVAAAKDYLEALEDAPLDDQSKIDDLNNKLKSSIEPFADNPAYQAFLELRRLGKIKE